MRWRVRHLGTVLACSFALCGCQPESEALPSEMLQVWTSDAPRYRERYFELRDDWVIFGTSARRFDIYALEHVESSPSTGRDRHYSIHYRAKDGETAVVKVIHHPGPQTTLRFANHDEVWIPGSNDF